MFANANPFAQFFKSFPQNLQDMQQNMQTAMNNMADGMKINASGPFGIPTYNAAQDKTTDASQDKEFSWAFDPQFNLLKGMDLSALKNMFPTELMQQWQDVWQSMGQNLNAAAFTPPNLTGMGGIPTMADLTSLSKISGVDWQALMNAQRKNMEAFSAAHHGMVESCQQYAKRQGEIFRQTMETAAQLTTDLMATGTPEEKMGRQVDILRQAFDIVSKHVRELTELNSKAQTEAMDMAGERVRESLDELKKSAKAAEDKFHAASMKADEATRAAAKAANTGSAAVKETHGGDALN